MTKAIIVDDEPHAIELLSGYLEKIPGIDSAVSFTNPIKAFQHIQQHPVDLIYLDIHMPELDGLQFLKLLAGKTQVILTTAYPEHALEGYEHDIVDYLLKPILFDRFLKATQKALQRLIPVMTDNKGRAQQPGDEEYIFVKTDIRNKLVKIRLAEVLYVEAMGNYVVFILTGGKIITHATIKETEERLSSSGFLRIHKSYIIPLYRIDSVEGSQVIIKSQKLPIGESYKELLFKNLF